MKAILVILICVLCAPVFADTLRDPPPPMPVTDAQRDALLKEFREKETPAIETRLRESLETEYRQKLEKRLAEEREAYTASINNLWMSNAAVWACLAVFIVLQAFAARKRMAEIARLKAMREGK